MCEDMEYGLLSEYYDRFTDDVPYDRWADFFERIFWERGKRPSLVLDLACGTGTLTAILARRGYDMIGVDQSEEMLTVAQENCLGTEKPVLLLHQSMQELELYGYVDACVCCLDSVNYVEDPDELREALQRVYTYLRPGGIFIFDINTRDKLMGIDGQSFVREDDGVFCVWQCAVEGSLCQYLFDLFVQKDTGGWERWQEEHVERIYEPEELLEMLVQAGFVHIEQRGELSAEPPKRGEERIFFIAEKE